MWSDRTHTASFTHTADAAPLYLGCTLERIGGGGGGGGGGLKITQVSISRKTPTLKTHTHTALDTGKYRVLDTGK